MGIIFAAYPMYSAEAVSWIAGICLIIEGILFLASGIAETN